MLVFCFYLVLIIITRAVVIIVPAEHVPRKSSRYRTEITHSGYGNHSTSDTTLYFDLLENGRDNAILMNFNNPERILKLLEDELAKNIVTSNPSDMNLQIRPPSSETSDHQPTVPSFSRQVATPPRQYSAEELLKSLSNHHVTVGNCIENRLSPLLCKDMMELASIHYEPKFMIDERFSIESRMQPDNMEFLLNSASLNDLWQNHINKENKLSLDIVETTYDELIYYYDTSVDPDFVVPRMSVPNYSEMTYGVNRAGHFDYYTQTLTKPSDLKPRILVHAPPGYPTNFLMNAMTSGYSHPRQSNIERMDSVSGVTANLPFGENTRSEEAFDDVNANQDFSYSYSEQEQLDTDTTTETYDPGLPIPPTRKRKDYLSDMIGSTSTVDEMFNYQPNLSSKKMMSPNLKEDTKIVIRLKTGSSEVVQKIEIPASRIDENGITEVRLKDGKTLRLRIKKRKPSPSTKDFLDNFTPNVIPNFNKFSLDSVKKKIHSIVEKVEGMTSGFEGDLDVAYDSADGFLKNMFGGMNTEAYYENILTVVAIASFVGFLYSRSVIIFNSLSPWLARTEAWWTLIKKREDIEGVAGVLTLIQEAVKMWGENNNKEDGDVFLETKEEKQIFLAPHNPYKITKRILNISDQAVTGASSLQNEKLSLIQEIEEVAKIGATMIDAALELRIAKQNENGTSCLAKPLCQLNRRTNDKGLKGFLIPLLSTIAQWLVVEPTDPFSTLELFRPLWLSQDTKEPCERILTCPHLSTHRHLFIP